MNISKNTALRINNILLYLGFSFLAGSGALLVFRLPCGKSSRLLGLDRHEWGNLHFCIALGVLALMLVHLFINRAWLAKIAGKGGRWKLGTGLGLGVAIIAAFFAVPLQASDDVEMCESCRDRNSCDKGGCEEAGDDGCEDCDKGDCADEDDGGCEDCDGCDGE